MTKQTIETHLNKVKPDQNTKKQTEIECSHITDGAVQQPDNEQEYLLDMSEISSQ